MLINKNTQTLNKDLIIEAVRTWAGLNSDALLDDKTLIFSTPSIEGFIGYRIAYKTAVVYGDPACHPKNKSALALAFKKYCEEKKLQTAYVIASEEFASYSLEALDTYFIEFGKNIILNPLEYEKRETSLLRRNIRHSIKEGIEVFEYTTYNAEVEIGINQVALEWVGKRRGIQVFLAKPKLFENIQGKRFFYAKREGKIVGFLALSELRHEKGWLLSNIMFSKDAPNYGLSEHMIATALQALAKEKCAFVIVGPVTATEVGKVGGLSPFWTFIAKAIFKCAKKLCRLDGHEIFWKKFKPDITPSFLVLQKKHPLPFAIGAVLRALNIKWQ